MADPVVSSVRVQRPWTVSVGLGSPDLLRAEVTRSVGDSFSVGGAIGFGPIGVQGSANAYWHALRSPNHGHSLILGAGLDVAPGVAAMAGNGGVYLGADASLGWEWRASFGLTTRATVGPAAYVGVSGPRPDSFVAPKGTLTLGWSF